MPRNYVGRSTVTYGRGLKPKYHNNVLHGRAHGILKATLLASAQQLCLLKKEAKPIALHILFS